MSAENQSAPAAAVQDEGYRVHFGNLNFSTTEEQVREFATKLSGEVTSVELPKRFNRPAGYAFVSYKNEADATKAVEQLNDQELEGRKVTAALARSKEESAARRKAAIERREAAKATQQLEAKQAEAGVEEPLTDTEAPAKAKKARKPKKKAPRRRQPGEEGEEGGEEAANGDASEAPITDAETKPKRKPRKAKDARIDADAGEETLVEKEKSEKAKKPRKPRGPKLELTGEQSKSTIFVANLPFDVDDNALAAIFTNLSISVKSAKVIQGVRRGKPGTQPFRASKGFGFVEVEDPAQQQEAVNKVEGSLVGDRTISAKIANEMKPIEREQAAEAEAAPAA